MLKSKFYKDRQEHERHSSDRLPGGSKAPQGSERGSLAVVQAPGLASKGGAERLALTVALCLRDRGYRVVVASPDSRRVDLIALGAYFDLDLSGLEHLATGGYNWSDRVLRPGLAALFRQVVLRAKLRRLKASLHVNAVYKSDVGSVAPKSIYYVHFPHHLVGRGSRRSDRIWGRVIPSVTKRALSGGRSHPATYDYILANSNFTAAEVRTRWQVDATVLEPPCPPQSPSVAPRGQRILAVGRFQDMSPRIPHKKQDVLIHQFSQMKDLHSGGWSLHLAGSVGSRRELERLRLLARGLPIEFHPDVSYSRLQELYSTSSIYWHAQGYGEDSVAFPETQEHFGITVVEAMAAGLLPVVYGTAGPMEIVQPVARDLSWNTLDELGRHTRKLALLSKEEEVLLRSRAMKRAHHFDEKNFICRFNATLASLEEQN